MHAKIVFPELLNFETHTVNRVDCVKFLGFMIDSTLSWNSHINYILRSVNWYAKSLFFYEHIVMLCIS